MQLINHLCFSPEISKKDYFQAIYTSQSYGTFYVIYAEFTTEEYNDNYFIKNINLKLVNYKGLINLGIANATFKPITDDDGNSKGALVSITIKAFEQETFMVPNCDDSHPFPKKESYLKVNRKLVPMHPDKSPLENGVFDDEFYYRDGIDARGRKGLSLQERKLTKNVSDDSVIDDTIEAFTPRCIVSLSRIL